MVSFESQCQNGGRIDCRGEALHKSSGNSSEIKQELTVSGALTAGGYGEKTAGSQIAFLYIFNLF